jgi:enoyl-CoA hydratase/carnithine racemase
MPIETEQHGKTLLITLNRPEKMNSLDQEMMTGLHDTWQRFRDDDDLWVAVVTGAGDRAFCSGRDLFAGAPGSFEYLQERKARGEPIEPHRQSFVPSDLWKPVIGAINGYALAGGFALALACDLRIAADTARMGSMSVKRNLLGGGQIVRLTHYVPFAKALEILLIGDHISAQDAERIGLVNAVVPQADLLPTALDWAERICKNGPLAVRAQKEVAYRSLELSWHDATRLEGEKYDEMLETEDVREGHLAFKERRDPVWKAR